MELPLKKASCLSQQILLKFSLVSHLFFSHSLFNPIQDEPFRGCSQIGGVGGWVKKDTPIRNICHAFPILMKLMMKIIQNIYEEDPEHI